MYLWPDGNKIRKNYSHRSPILHWKTMITPSIIYLYRTFSHLFLFFFVQLWREKKRVIYACISLQRMLKKMEAELSQSTILLNWSIRRDNRWSSTTMWWMHLWSSDVRISPTRRITILIFCMFGDHLVIARDYLLSHEIVILFDSIW